MMSAPMMTDPGITYLLSFPTNRFTRWGAIRPTKAMTPMNATQTAVSREVMNMAA